MNVRYTYPVRESHGTIAIVGSGVPPKVSWYDHTWPLTWWTPGAVTDVGPSGRSTLAFSSQRVEVRW